MAESGILAGGNLGEGNFEFPSMDQVSAADAARRARERVELVNLLSLFAGAAPNLCCNDLDLKACAHQPGACDCDRPGAEECLGHCSGQGADAQADGFDGGVGVNGGPLDGDDHRMEQTEFMHLPMMTGSAEGER